MASKNPLMKVHKDMRLLLSKVSKEEGVPMSLAAKLVADRYIIARQMKKDDKRFKIFRL